MFLDFNSRFAGASVNGSEIENYLEDLEAPTTLDLSSTSVLSF